MCSICSNCYRQMKCNDHFPNIHIQYPETHTNTTIIIVRGGKWEWEGLGWSKCYGTNANWLWIIRNLDFLSFPVCLDLHINFRCLIQKAHRIFCYMQKCLPSAHTTHTHTHSECICCCVLIMYHWVQTHKRMTDGYGTMHSHILHKTHFCVVYTHITRKYTWCICSRKRIWNLWWEIWFCSVK